MKILLVKSASDVLLLFVFLNVLWNGIESESVTTPKQDFHMSTISPSKQVTNVKVLNQNETSITLSWENVDNTSSYYLVYDDTSNEISGAEYASSVQYVVSSLIAGTTYNFTLHTGNISSEGYSFRASTAPKNVNKVQVVDQTETSITLEWDKVGESTTYILNYDSRSEKVPENENSQVQYVALSLNAGMTYDFTLITVFNEINSTGLTFSASTVPEMVKNVRVTAQNKTNITLKWDKVGNITTYILDYNGRSENVSGNEDSASVRYEAFSLDAGMTYNFSLFTVFKGIKSTEYTFCASTTPNDVDKVDIVTQDETSITLRWNKTNTISKYILKYNDKEIDVDGTGQGELMEHVVDSLVFGTNFTFTLVTVFETRCVSNPFLNSTGLSFSAVTAPANINEVKAVTQNETSITLEWDKMKNIKTYTLEYEGKSINITSNETINTPVQHVVPLLTAGTIHNFTLITTFEYVNSTGYNFSFPTAPSEVSSVRVTERLINSIKLQWTIPNPAWNYHLEVNATGESIHKENLANVASYSVSNLNPGTLYEFSVITQFSELNSTVYKDIIVTALNCTSINWQVTNSSIQGTVEGLFSNAIATNKSQNYVSPGGGNVSFTGLYPGATYEISLKYEMSSTSLLQCQHNLTIVPPVLSAHCEFWSSGYAARIVWNKPEGVWTKVEVNVTEAQPITVDSSVDHIIAKKLQPAKKYSVSLASLSGKERKSEAFVFTCRTDDRGVIGGSVFGVLLFIVLVCGAVFIFLQKPDLLRGKKSLFNGSKKTSIKKQVIPVANFPNHYTHQSMDENRGFSLDYEELAPVGTEQTHRVALLPENKGKNRFSNVLPYDWCRVKLETSSPNEVLDYINANYMPGYVGKREYIAAQGPLPSTVNDFWRMIWEQKVKRIVMVTNCTESGRTKCEQYWPEGSNPCTYGDLVVTVRSEQKELSWTLREFKVENKNTSEQRTVIHFHFTAWPDHGVPLDTQVLIQFRGLVRRHIQSDDTEAPTVVHCSAGVGRTGTIITLDVVLQQLEKEKVIGIKAFVYKLRLNRPLMVQTESQYIFLHQCIMDILQPSTMSDEHIYENTDMIYVNATALQELH